MDSQTLPRKVLIVEDDPVSRMITCKILERAGYAVTEAVSIDEALVQAATGSPDAIILDWKIAEKTGAEFLEKRKSLENLKEVPVIVLSGKTSPQGVWLTKTLGAFAFLPKPVDTRLLLQKLNDCLRKKSNSAAA